MTLVTWLEDVGGPWIHECFVMAFPSLFTGEQRFSVSWSCILSLVTLGEGVGVESLGPAHVIVASRFAALLHQ